MKNCRPPHLKWSPSLLLTLGCAHARYPPPNSTLAQAFSWCWWLRHGHMKRMLGEWLGWQLQYPPCSIHFKYLLGSHMLELYTKGSYLLLVECTEKWKLALTVSRVFMLTDFVNFTSKYSPFVKTDPFPRQLLPVTFKCSYFRELCGPCHTAELAPKYPEKIDRQSWYYRRQRIDRFN